MFQMEQEEYKKEKVQWEQVTFIDNQGCIDLIEHPNKSSLFKLLDEAIMLKSGDDKLVSNYND